MKRSINVLATKTSTQILEQRLAIIDRVSTEEFLLFLLSVGTTLVPGVTSPVCKENEELKQCGIACEPSCNQQPRQPCPAVCIPNVCQCKRGYVRAANKACVRREECPVTTPDPAGRH